MVMKFLIKQLLLLLLLLFTAGCMSTDTVIFVKKDGSGTIEMAFMIDKKSMKVNERMLAQMNNEKVKLKAKHEKDYKLFDIFDEIRHKEKAKDFGEGVKFLSGEKISNQDFEGYKAIYEFADINKVKFKQNIRSSVPFGPNSMVNNPIKNVSDVTFYFAKGNPSTLIIRLPEKKTVKKKITKKKSKVLLEGDKDVYTVDQGIMAMLTETTNLIGGFRISMAIEVQGTIKETNAIYRQGSRVTLLDLDFAKIFDSKVLSQDVKTLLEAKPETMEDLEGLLKDLPDIKIDKNKEVKIMF